MSQPAIVAVVGAITVSPANPVSTAGNPGSTLAPTFNLASSTTYAEHQEGSLSLASAVNFPLPFGTIAAAGFVYIKVLSGALAAKFTSAAGAAQVLQSSDALLVSDPRGTGYTAVTLTGTADIEYEVAGN